MKKEKKLSSSGMSTRDKMLARKKKLQEKGGGGFVFPKEGVTRVRMKSPGDDKELGLEIIQFYPNPKIGGIISPATFEEPCPWMEKYQELKNSKDEADKELAKKLIPRRKYVIGGIVYEDEKGLHPDYNGEDKAILISSGVYQDIIDLYLDEDDYGDMTDPIKGYDIKIQRTGSGKNDTTYSVRPCKPSKLDSKYRGTIDLEGIVRNQILSYDELENKLREFLNEDYNEDEEEVPQSKSKKKDKIKKVSHKKYKSDI